MIKLNRIVTEYQLTYPGVHLLEPHEMDGVPKLFEQHTRAFYCGKELYLVPDYRIVHCCIQKGKVRPPRDGIFIKQLTLNYEITHENVTVIPEDQYARFGIPMVFDKMKQLAFMTKEGIWVTSDIQVILARLE